MGEHPLHLQQKNEWEKSFEIRDELFSDESIIMPNHIHGILILNDKFTPHLKYATSRYLTYQKGYRQNTRKI